MPALLQAFARLVALKRLDVLLFVLAATLCASSNASAIELAQTKTCVWGFDSAEHNSYGLFRAATSGKHKENRLARTGIASGSLLAAEGAGAAATTEFQVADRVAGQLADSRLGSLAGKISPERLQQLANNPNALRFLDTASGNTNVVQLVEGRLLRITTAGDEAGKIISVGPIQQNGLFNGIANGRFELLIP